jgi:hypothetical protein
MALRRAITKFLSLSDGDNEAPRVLLTGGLLVRIQPEEPIFSSRRGQNGDNLAKKRDRFSFAMRAEAVGLG